MIISRDPIRPGRALVVACNKILGTLAAAVFCATVLFASTASAAPTPETTVKEIVDKIKAAASPSPIIEYVDWDGAFQGLPEEQKAMMKITSSSEMKGLYRKILEDPIAAMKEKMKEQMATIPAEQQAAAQQQMAHMEEMIGQQKAKMTEQIKATEYEIGKSTVDGDKATVKLTQSYQGQKREEEIALVKKGDKWLLSSVDMFKPRQGPPAGAGAPGGMPKGAKPMTPPPAAGKPEAPAVPAPQ